MLIFKQSSKLVGNFASVTDLNSLKGKSNDSMIVAIFNYGFDPKRNYFELKSCCADIENNYIHNVKEQNDYMIVNFKM